MSATIHTLTIVDTDGCESTTTIHRTLGDAEAALRAEFHFTDEYGEMDLLDFIRKVEEVHWMVVSITSHPLRSIATDVSGIDQPLLAEQVRALERIIGRCDEDAASTVITVGDAEREHLEGILQMVTGLLRS